MIRKILFIDTETNGRPNFNLRASDPRQPHIVQYAGVMFENGNIIDEQSILARPVGWVITPELEAIHGISHQYALAKGIPESELAKIALKQIRDADITVSYNHQFDKFMVRIALRRYGLFLNSDDAWWKSRPTACVMKMIHPVCKLPKNKWPKLQEAHECIFGEKFDGAHDAVADVMACSRLFFWLQENGHCDPILSREC